MKSRPVGAKLLRGNREENGRTDRYDKANNRFFFAVLRTRLKTHSSLLIGVARK
jgi:hypothetical protein